MMWRNCTVWLAGIVGIMAVSGAGCGGSDDSAIRVRWDVAYVGESTVTTCEALGTPSVAVRVFLARSNSAVASATFPCRDRIGVTNRLPSDLYDVQLSLLDAKGRAVAEVTYTDLETRRSGVTEPGTDALFQAQAWNLGWVVQKVGPGGRPVASSCEAVGAKTVEFTWQLAGEAPDTVDFDCTLYAGSSPAIRTGLYQAQMLLLDAGRHPLSDTGSMSQRVTDDPGSVRIDADLLVQ
jgi:hypothetical protein